MRQTPFGGIGDHAKGSKGQIIGSRETRRDMRFRIDRDGACCDMQGPLIRRIRYRHIDTRHIDDRCATESGRQTMRPSVIAFVDLAVFGNDRARDKRRSGGDTRRETAGDAEADDCRHFIAKRMVELVGEANRVAGAPDDGGVRSHRDARLGDEARHRENSAAFYMPN